MMTRSWQLVVAVGAFFAPAAALQAQQPRVVIEVRDSATREPIPAAAIYAGSELIGVTGVSGRAEVDATHGQVRIARIGYIEGRIAVDRTGAVQIVLLARAPLLLERVDV